MPKCAGLEITQEQFDSYLKVVQRQGEIPIVHRGIAGDKYIGCEFSHIFIGIEPDGCAHS